MPTAKAPLTRSLIVASALLSAVVSHAATNPLPSWRDGPGTQRIFRFVTDVTTPGAPGYATPADRIAVFDDDGTLWPEKPRAQGMFALERLRTEASWHPDWQTRLPFKAALELGSKYLQEASDEAIFQLVAAAYAGRTQDGFRNDVREYFATARHPDLDKPYTQLAYEPMRELIAYLKANGFHVFVVTTGSVDVVRVLSEELYGIPADDVIGSSVVTTLREEDGRLVLRRLGSVHALNDGPVKPLGIDLHIGRRPIIAAGNVNSGGDIEMLRYSQDGGQDGGQDGSPGSIGSRPTLQILVKHDDFEREYSYDEKERTSLNAADANGWMIVSMRFDWRRVFSFQEASAPPARDDSGSDGNDAQR